MGPLDKAIKTLDDKDDPPIFDYEFDVYENWGKEQKFKCKMQYSREGTDLVSLKRDLTYIACNRLNMRNLSVKNIRVIKVW